MRRLWKMIGLVMLAGALSAGGASEKADQGKSTAAPEKTQAAKPGSPSPHGDAPPEYEMRKYVIGFLYRGPNRPTDPEKAKELQRGHLANIARLHEEGKIILAGPFLDDQDMRGIFLFHTESVEEAKALCDTDPAVKAGSLRVELRPWYSAKGIGIRSEGERP